MPLSDSSALTDTFIAEIKRRLFGESIPRLKKCLDKLSDEQIWYRPNNPDVRERQKEFDEKGPVPREKMIANMDQLMSEVDQILNKVSSKDLLAVRNVQGFKESGLSILVHITEHFSYRVGQMTYIVKMLRDTDMNYYDGHNLDAK